MLCLRELVICSANLWLLSKSGLGLSTGSSKGLFTKTPLNAPTPQNFTCFQERVVKSALIS